VGECYCRGSKFSFLVDLRLILPTDNSFSNKVLAQRIQSSDTDLTQVDLYIADIKDRRRTQRTYQKKERGGMQSNGSEE